MARTVLLACPLVLAIAAAGACYGPGANSGAGIDRPVTGVEGVSPLGEGQRAPTAVLRDAQGRLVNAGGLYPQGPTMLIFYRGGWCPYCTQHLAELASIESDIEAMGIQIVAVSPDRPEKLREAADEAQLGYRLLSDSDAHLARAFGVAFRVDDETIAMYDEFGIDLEESSGRPHGILPVPAVYLIDTGGVIRFAHWDPDYRQRISGDGVLAAAREMAERN